MKAFDLLLCLVLFCGCSSFQNETEKTYIRTTSRSITSEDYFAPRDIRKSPYKNIKEIDYQAIVPGLNQYISSRPYKIPFQNQEQRWTWAEKTAQSNKDFFSILPFKSEISNQLILKNEPLVQKINSGAFDNRSRDIKWAMQQEWFAEALPSKLFSYQISKPPSKNKPTILIWAKEHGDELAPPEFTTQLSEFFLFHLRGEGDPLINKIVQNLFDRLNIVVVPDMTPNKNFETFENETSTVEDFNGYGVLLQPFNYDSNNPDDYILAPEAAYLKTLILSLDNLALGIDIHTPFGISVIAGPDDSVAENNRFLIAEAQQVKNCITNLQRLKPDEQCRSGVFQVAHPQISGGVEIATSYFSRTKLAPSILLELDRGRPEDYKYEGTKCQKGHKEQTCDYYTRPHLQQMLPYFLRVMEIIARS